MFDLFDDSEADELFEPELGVFLEQGFENLQVEGLDWGGLVLVELVKMLFLFE